ncbi:CHC2 zinc finger domain-containing protein [Bacillus cereus group sp. Bce003]|uniref:CHC2 zinc finger domain-containing protein n=1 Tax=Bacillus cereus group sp. Bce003 TaxID=3445258 RepID=UPI0040430477
MLIRSIGIEIDIHTYLSSKGLHNVRPVGRNVMACCPFHEDSSPSFGVDTETGVYNCFGCGAKGSFGHLVKYLDDFDTVYDAEDYLINMFGRYAVDVDEPIELQFTDDLLGTDYWLEEELTRQYDFRHPYLGTRGISEKWQSLMGIGFCKRSNAITIPWRDYQGRLLTFKKRSVLKKKFWYDPVMPPRIKAETLWGLDKVLKWRLNKVAITEAELDGLSVWQAEQVGDIGIGGNQFNDEQARTLIKVMPSDTEFISFTDNDEGGILATELIAERLAGRYKVSQVDWGIIEREDVKDANDLTTDEIRLLLANRRTVGLKLF